MNTTQSNRGVQTFSDHAIVLVPKPVKASARMSYGV